LGKTQSVLNRIKKQWDFVHCFFDTHFYCCWETPCLDLVVDNQEGSIFMQKIWNSLMFVKVIIQAKLEDLISKSGKFQCLYIK